MPQLIRTVFSVPKMDCPSEENLVRMALADLPGTSALDFDLPNRQLTVLHEAAASEVLSRLERLQLGAVQQASAVAEVAAMSLPDAGDRSEARTLRILLAINASMFVLELVIGLVVESTGLVADSLDMFADAGVYGLALYAVGRSAAMKFRAAHLAGWLQVALAAGALVEVARRFAFGSEPEAAWMMGIGLLALIANATCLVLVARQRDRGAHMKASYIFSATDVIANLGVVLAGILVSWTGSRYPDLVLGTAIAAVVLAGGMRILRLR
ncbi:MAG: cation transporter [Burkholderiales bacterium]|nr:cation transporter [Burkholderiales bacterium]